ncbi:hypothetical protein GS937_21770 [Rhodococcus hoagii]|nr:hypothetical protein [Prescottella equi]
MYKASSTTTAPTCSTPSHGSNGPSSKTSTSRRRPRSSKHSPTPRRSTSTSSPPTKTESTSSAPRPTKLRAAWDKADENARRIGTSIYERSSRNKLRKAAYALRTALDTSATAAERQAATETVKKLTDGLVKAPERVLSAVTAAIDTARRKELPVGLNQ